MRFSQSTRTCYAIPMKSPLIIIMKEVNIFFLPCCFPQIVKIVSLYSSLLVPSPPLQPSWLQCTQTKCAGKQVKSVIYMTFRIKVSQKFAPNRAIIWCLLFEINDFLLLNCINYLIIVILNLFGCDSVCCNQCDGIGIFFFLLLAWLHFFFVGLFIVVLCVAFRFIFMLYTIFLFFQSCHLSNAPFATVEHFAIRNEFDLHSRCLNLNLM